MNPVHSMISRLEKQTLHEKWTAPDLQRLTKKQYSFRLPVTVADRLLALCDKYPDKTLTQIVGDLLDVALKEIEIQMACVVALNLDEKPWEKFNLSCRCSNVLIANDINTVHKLVQYSRRELLHFPNMGNASVNEIEQGLSSHGLQLKK